MASLSRSLVFILAYFLEVERLTLLEGLVRLSIAARSHPSSSDPLPFSCQAKIKKVWDATWPNDHFLRELQAFEEELGLGPRAK